jgi:hypothetical protein
MRLWVDQPFDPGRSVSCRVWLVPGLSNTVRAAADDDDLRGSLIHGDAALERRQCLG